MTERCQELASRLSDFVDRGLDPQDDRAVREHLEGCAACRGIVQDLERLRTTARALGPLAPPDHLWMQVAGRIRLDLERARAQGATRVPNPGSPTRPSLVPWLGLAAALVLITIGVYVITSLSSRVSPATIEIAAGNPAAADPVETAVAELQKAATHYENAMLELDRLAQTNNGSIEPGLAKLLRDQLEVADRAIAQSREAMQSDPTSQAARESLFDAFRRKVGVLQATVSLMNEMRQGNPGGASQAAAGLNNKKG